MNQRKSTYQEINYLIQELRKNIFSQVGIYALFAGVLYEKLVGVSWAGFYLAHHDRLEIGPYHGALPCTHLALNQGVCGTAFYQKKTLIIDNVDECSFHIACSSETKSEIVVPVFDLKNRIVGVLDLDSNIKGHFSDLDKVELESLVKFLFK